jgi:hypothetical protein
VVNVLFFPGIWRYLTSEALRLAQRFKCHDSAVFKRRRAFQAPDGQLSENEQNDEP